jgi:hypothetical protein
MQSKILPSLVALSALLLMAAYFPPGPFSWHVFFTDRLSLGAKAVYLLKVYAVPALLSFTAIVLLQLQMRFSVAGAPAHVLFPLSIGGATAMLSAFRTMTAGVGGIPGYVLGLALAYTIMSKFAGVRPSGRYVWGVQTLQIVWRGQPGSVRQRPPSVAVMERAG